jgi:hypothetical protein
MILERKDVQFFELHQTRTTPNVSLKVSGLAFHSSLAVSSVSTRMDDDCMVVLINLEPTRTGLTRNFAYEFDIPEKVNSVCFGSTKYVIWKRGIGPVK